MKKINFVFMPFMVVSFLASCGSSSDDYVTVHSGLGCFYDKSITQTFKIGVYSSLKDVILDLPTYTPDVVQELEPPLTRKPCFFIDSKNNKTFSISDKAQPGMELTCYYFDSYESYHNFCLGENMRYRGAATAAYPGNIKVANGLIEMSEKIEQMLNSINSVDYLYVQGGLLSCFSSGYYVAARCFASNKPNPMFEIIDAIRNIVLINNHLSIGLGTSFISYLDALGETGKGPDIEEANLIKNYLPNIHPNAYLALEKTLDACHKECKRCAIKNADCFLQYNCDIQEIFYKGLHAAKENFALLNAIGEAGASYYHAIGEASMDWNVELIEKYIEEFKITIDNILNS